MQATGNTIIDAEAYQVNSDLLPQLDRLSPHIRRNLAEGAAISPDEVVAADRARRSVRGWFSGMLSRFPFLALPTLVAAPPLLGQRSVPLTLLTMPANVAGLPALALPVPGGPAGMPTSLQLIGPLGGEERLLSLGHVVQAALAAG